MANEKNLKPFEIGRSSEEAVRNGKKGGIKSGEARRRKVDLKNVITEMLNSKVCKYQALQLIAEKYGLNDRVTVKELVTLGAMLKAATDGSANDLLKIMELIGETPTDDKGTMNDGDVLEVVFVDNAKKDAEEDET